MVLWNISTPSSLYFPSKVTISCPKSSSVNLFIYSVVGSIISDLVTVIQTTQVQWHLHAYVYAVYSRLVRPVLLCIMLGLQHPRSLLQTRIWQMPQLGRLFISLLSAHLPTWLTWDLSKWCWVSRRRRPRGQTQSANQHLPNLLSNQHLVHTCKCPISKRNKSEVNAGRDYKGHS